jgi:hypothetical protein
MELRGEPRAKKRKEVENHCSKIILNGVLERGHYPSPQPLPLLVLPLYVVQPEHLI